MSKSAKHLLWIDIESDSLPVFDKGVSDFSNVNIMEVGVILTDSALNILPQGGYSEVVKMNPAIADGLRSNPEVLEMHRTSGLVKDCVEATMTIEEIDAEVSKLIAEVGAPKGDFAIAGSGVAMFDFPLVRSAMPQTASWLAYYPYDAGIFRRLIRSMAGREVVNPHLASYGSEKLHRAMADIEAHLREAQAYRDWIRSILPDIDPEMS